MWPSLLGFGIAVLPLVVTPGASFALATQRTAASERHAAARVVAGTATGIYVHALLAGLGLSALVLRSSQAFEVVRLAGAAYLIGLGVLTLARSRARASRSARRLPWSGRATLPQAFLANLLNPKAASVYLTLAPQFLAAETVGVRPLLALATVHIAVMAGWLTVWTTALRGSRRLLDSQRARTAIDRTTGSALVALGLREALT